MIDGEAQQQPEFRVKPTHPQQPWVEPYKHQAEQQGQNRADRHDRVKPALHDDEAIPRYLVFSLCVIDEESWQIEQAGEPRHHEGDVQRLDPDVVGNHR